MIAPPSNGETVALVHGFLANRLVMAPLSWRLRSRGYRTLNWGYVNMRCSLLVHARGLARQLARLDADPAVDRIHLCTHSMGCIIGRAALAIERPRKLGRFVMLAPPNRGSFVATRAAKALGRVLRPVSQLSEAENSLVNALPIPENVDIGIIAARWDALITQEATRLPGPHVHTTLATWHTGLLFHRETADMVAGFLATGSFPNEMGG